MSTTIRLLGISGSLRKESYNTKLLNNLQRLLPENTILETATIGDLPLYNEDSDIPAQASRPEAVEKFRAAIAAADGLVIVSPEYNHSIPGTLKNAIDWASRGKDSPLPGKPVTFMGASPGMWGTAHMQLALLAVLHTLNMPFVSKPQILLSKAHEKFDTEGNLTDETAKKLITQNLVALRELVVKSKTI